MRIRMAGLRLALSWVCAWAAGGCAVTELSSFTDPDFTNYHPARVMLTAGLEHLDQKAEAEDIFLDAFKGLDLSCCRSIDVLLPTRQYADEELFAALKKAQVQAVLLIRETDYYEDLAYVPQTSTTSSYGNLSANTYYSGNRAYTYGTGHGTSYTTTSGGYYVSKPRVRHELKLYDVPSKRVAWIGGAFTQGSGKAQFEHLIGSLARETARRLKKDGLAEAVQH